MANTISASTYQRINAALALVNEAQATHRAIFDHPGRRAPAQSERIDRIVDRSNARVWRRIRAWEVAVNELPAA